jgi:hypothetical protein
MLDCVSHAECDAECDGLSSFGKLFVNVMIIAYLNTRKAHVV